MILGEEILKKMYPDFKDDLTPNGIDLRCSELFYINNTTDVGMYDEKKFLPKHSSAKLSKKQTRSGKLVEGWYLSPGVGYIINVDRKMKIPQDIVQLYYPRSTLLRSGVVLHTAVGDSGFNNTLSFLIINEGDNSFFLGKGERFCQAVSFEVEGGGTYDGDYQGE